MSERLLIISSDGHIGPPAENYRDYMDPKFVKNFDDWFAQYVPRWLTKGTTARESIKQANSGEFNMWGDEYQKAFAERAKKIPWGIEGKWDPKRRLEALDIDGVAADILFPDDQSSNSPPFLGLARDYSEPWDKYTPEDRREGARAYNRWLAEFCSESPERLLGIALIGSLSNVEDAIETATWAKEHGINGGVMVPVHYYNINEPFLNDRGLDPFWAACQEMDLPVHTHIGPGSPCYGDDPFEAGLLWAMESTYWVHRPLWFLIMSGVCERFPNLKLVFTEQGVQWAVDAVRAMDGLLESKMVPFSGDERMNMFSLKPSEYFKRQVWIGATNTDALGWVTPAQRESLGYERLMWGSDYPHLESMWPHTKEKLAELLVGIPAHEAEAIVAGNAVECYSVDVAKLAPIVAEIGPEVGEVIAV